MFAVPFNYSLIFITDMPLSKTQKAALALLLVIRRRHRQNRRWWIHPIISERSIRGKFVTLYRKLQMHPEKYLEYYRMSLNSFNCLLSAVKNQLERTNTVMRESIGVDEKISITLR